jgi:hypothetical protein
VGRSRVAVVAAVGAVALAAVVADAGTSSRAAPRVGSAGVTIRLPRGWHAIPFTLPPPGYKNDPVTRIVAASGHIWFGKGCNDVDYSFPATAVALVVLEWVGLAPHLPPRPARFTAKTLPVRPPPAIECFNGPGGSVDFRDHSRRFAAFLLLGRRASAQLAGRARAVLNTLRVTKRGRG